MKARVKATGEIVDVYSSIHKGCDYDGSDGYSYMKEDIIILDDEPDYWTRLEHQYAGMAMQAYIIASHISQFSFCEGDMKDCKSMAHALVEKLKSSDL